MERKVFMCGMCSHFHERSYKEGEAIVYTCDAFPDEIPEDIAYWRRQHREHIDGDNGIKFVARKEVSSFFKDGDLSEDEIEK